ncbi:MAG: hypothetical protein ACXWPM_00350 [Bdellovibrionota bacterium]
MKGLLRTIGLIVLSAFLAEVAEPSSIFVRVEPPRIQVQISHVKIGKSSTTTQLQFTAADSSLSGPTTPGIPVEHSATAVTFFRFDVPRLIAVRVETRSPGFLEDPSLQLLKPPKLLC